MIELTKSQQAAVYTRSRNILVSAAAGSGKTATLTRRITELISDGKAPASLSDMLVVTFTNAAAAELKSRIISALTEALMKNPCDGHIASELTSANSASISTIDSYYLSLVKDNFQRLGIPSSFRICGDDEIASLKKEILDDIINRRLDGFYPGKNDVNYVNSYNSGDETDAFRRFHDSITSFRSDKDIEETITDLAEQLLLFPGGTDYLLTCADEYHKEQELPFGDSRCGKFILSELEKNFENFLERAKNCLPLAMNTKSYGPEFEYLIGYCEEILPLIHAGDFSAMRAKADEFNPVSKAKNTTFLTNERKDIITSIKKLFENLVQFDSAELALALQYSEDICRVLHSVISEYNTVLTREKLVRQVLEFEDLRRYALQLLIDENGNPTDIALAEQAKYSHIFVDEYQDTDGVQDRIFRTISNGSNLFIVGDIKQSIYSFRGAEPDLFASYRDAWKPLGDCPSSDDPCSIYMSENFRCSKNVIDFTNMVCSYIFMSAQENGRKGIGYRKEDDLVYSRSGKDSGTPVKIVFCERQPKIKNPKTGRACSDGTDPEGEYIANEIIRIVNNEKKPDGSPYNYGDIAILARKNDICTRISKALGAHGIPFNNADGDQLFENQEVLLFYSVLCAIDNPQKDIPLAAAMKSPFFGFTLTDTVKIRIGRTKMSLYDSVDEYAVDGSDAALSKKCGDFLIRLNELRRRSEAISADRFIRILWAESEAMSYAGISGEKSQSSPDDKRRNLRMLYDFALHFRGGEFRTLHDFILYVSDILSRGKKIKVSSPATPDAVQLLTVHKSKGLEYPVVFLCGCEKSFSDSDVKKTSLLCPSDNIGFVTKIADNSGFSSRDNVLRRASLISLCERQKQEEMRILYVALTRARELLYITSAGENGYSDKALDDAEMHYVHGMHKGISEGTCWLDWILTSARRGLYSKSYVTECVHPFDDSSMPEASGKTVSVSNTDIDKMQQTFLTQLSYRYPYSSLSGIPSKISVSRLYPGFLDEDDDESSLEKKVQTLEPRKPDFSGTVHTAAEKGTATHLFLQFCDFSALNGSEEDARREASRLEAEKFIPKEALTLIRYNEIAKFSGSRFFERLRKSTDVHRETRFNILLPASDFAEDSSKKELLTGCDIFVQGVIDLFFTDCDGHLILCDYKTDRLTPEELTNPDTIIQKMTSVHGEQLRYYAESIKRLTGKYPDETLVFPLCYGEAVKISL